MSDQRQTGDALVGSVLDDSYRVESLLGEGGMGAVYKGTQLRLDKPVAIKVMTRELATNQEALERFRREARITSSLGHPNIVQVFDFSVTPSGEPFLVMEFLEGEDLEHRLRRVGRLSLQEVVHTVKQTGSALAATHSKGIVHRDLKPANIYLLRTAGAADFVKVLDFGISKMRSATAKLTRTSSVMGTPNYMSPEQAQGRVAEIDERTDQWALACIAWECLSGRRAFDGEEATSILYQVVHEPPAPLAIGDSNVKQGVERVLLQALAKQKEDRFPSVDDFVVALENACEGAAGAKGFEHVARTVPLTVRVTDDDPGRTSPSGTSRSTTFTGSSGQLEDSMVVRPRASWRPWGAIAGGATAVLSVAAVLLLRPGVGEKPSDKPKVTTPAPALNPPASSSAPLPAPAPPPPLPPAAEPPAPAQVAVPAEPAGQPASTANRKRIKKDALAKPAVAPSQAKPTLVPSPQSLPEPSPSPATAKGRRRFIEDL